MSSWDPTIEVHEPEEATEPYWTGLYTPEGRKLYRWPTSRNPIGFTWRDDGTHHRAPPPGRDEA